MALTLPISLLQRSFPNLFQHPPLTLTRSVPLSSNMLVIFLDVSRKSNISLTHLFSERETETPYVAGRWTVLCSKITNLSSSLKITHWKPSPKMMAIEGGTFGRWLGHENRELMNVINNLTKEAPDSSLSPFQQVRFQQKDGQVGCGTSLDTNQLVPWSWTSSVQKCEK